VIYTSGLKEGPRDEIGVFPVEEMEATVEFDTTRCQEGIWTMTISKTITKRFSNASIGEPSPESEVGVRNTKQEVQKKNEIFRYFLNQQGRLIERK
jgi:hypothetical protein